jgi:hypothetical protein
LAAESQLFWPLAAGGRRIVSVHGTSAGSARCVIAVRRERQPPDGRGDAGRSGPSGKDWKGSDVGLADDEAKKRLASDEWSVALEA